MQAALTQAPLDEDLEALVAPRLRQKGLLNARATIAKVAPNRPAPASHPSPVPKRRG